MTYARNKELLKNCDIMTLEKYKEKRNFKKTNEPKGEIPSKKSKETIFVIHEHHASHLHWDLRLEMEGILKSWAVPKDPLLTLEGKKILAVEVEDHPLFYGLWHGTIPPGNYGAGTVEIWDKGTYDLIEKTDKGFVIKINGKKLNGTFVLFKFKPPKNWLFFKKK
jgi:DNA ligase D-like protein (predicted 3'-phosphoesterase)